MLIAFRMKTYAELYGNMQKYRIKSLYGNILNLALASSISTKSTFENLGAAAKLASSPMATGLLRSSLFGTQSKISEAMEGLIKPINATTVMGNILLHRQVIDSCKSG